jgi:hypothetical protein
LGITPAVAGYKTDTTSDKDFPATPTGDSARLSEPSEIVGIWKSEVRDTKHGPMTFEFRIGRDGMMKVTGTPANGSEAEAFLRNGPYKLDGEQLVTPTLNKGQPVHVRLQAGRLILTIDESLVFELGRALE